MSNTEVRAYLAQLIGTESFDALDPSDQDKEIFAAGEMLRGEYGKRVKAEHVAWQILFTLEAKYEHYNQLKRHGATSFNTKGTSVSFGKTVMVAPEVQSILGVPRNGGGVGRLG
jgi:hypothetical protein